MEKNDSEYVSQNLTRTKERYLNKISSKAYNTQVNCKACFRNFEDFCKKQFESTMNQMIEDLEMIRDIKQQKRKSLDVLQDFVNYMHGIGINPSTIKVYFTHIKKFFRWQGIDIDSDDIKDMIDFPKPLKEESEALTEDHVKKILDHSNLIHKTLYLLLSSSGMRISEALSLRKRDFDLTTRRIKITIPAIHTKTKQGRFTFTTRESQEYLEKVLKGKKEDDFVFIQYNPKNVEGVTVLEKRKIANEMFVKEIIKAKNTQEKYFERVRKQAGFTETKESRVHKITLHSFRSFFITKCNKIDFGIGHALAGHGYYMKKYNRYTHEEMLEFFIKSEPYLQIFNKQSDDDERITQLELEIETLKKENEMRTSSLIKTEQVAESHLKLKKEIISELKKELQK